MVFVNHLPAVLVLTSLQIHVLRTPVNCDEPDVLWMEYEWKRPFVNHCTCLDFLTSILRTVVNCNKADVLTHRYSHNPVVKHLPNNLSTLWLGIYNPDDQFWQNLWEIHYHKSNSWNYAAQTVLIMTGCLHAPYCFNDSKLNCMLSWNNNDWSLQCTSYFQTVYTVPMLMFNMWASFHTQWL